MTLEPFLYASNIWRTLLTRMLEIYHHNLSHTSHTIGSRLLIELILPHMVVRQLWMPSSTFLALQLL